MTIERTNRLSAAISLLALVLMLLLGEGADVLLQPPLGCPAPAEVAAR